MTTQNVHRKTLHALHFKQTMFVKYFSSYIKVSDGNLQRHILTNIDRQKKRTTSRERNTKTKQKGLLVLKRRKSIEIVRGHI